MHKGCSSASQPCGGAPDGGRSAQGCVYNGQHILRGAHQAHLVAFSEAQGLQARRELDDLGLQLPAHSRRSHPMPIICCGPQVHELHMPAEIHQQRFTNNTARDSQEGELGGRVLMWVDERQLVPMLIR